MSDSKISSDFSSPPAAPPAAVEISQPNAAAPPADRENSEQEKISNNLSVQVDTNKTNNNDSSSEAKESILPPVAPSAPTCPPPASSVSSSLSAAYSQIRTGKLQLKGNTLKRPNPSATASNSLKSSSSSEMSKKSKGLGDPLAAMTKSELNYQEALNKRESQIIAQRLSMSHRARIEQFNEKLNKLSDHNDLPRVGPG